MRGGVEGEARRHYRVRGVRGRVVGGGGREGKGG